MVEIVTDPDSVSFSDVESTVQSWKDNHEEVLTEKRSSLSHIEKDEYNKVEQFRGFWRFSLNEDKQNLIDEIENALKNNFKWWVVRHHLCDHDETERGDCSWDYENSQGTVPEGV